MKRILDSFFDRWLQVRPLLLGMILGLDYGVVLFLAMVTQHNNFVASESSPQDFMRYVNQVNVVNWRGYIVGAILIAVVALALQGTAMTAGWFLGLMFTKVVGESMLTFYSADVTQFLPTFMVTIAVLELLGLIFFIGRGERARRAAGNSTGLSVVGFRRSTH